jgi:hypothetical protein
MNTWRPHYSHHMRHAANAAPNMVQALKSAAERTGDPELVQLADDAQTLARRVSMARLAADVAHVEHLNHPDREQFMAGTLPWPDDTLASYSRAA